MPIKKAQTNIPPMFSTRDVKEKEEKKDIPEKKSTSRTTAKSAENLYQVLVETEHTIQELTSLYAETENSKHTGAGGKLKLTSQQELIQRQLSTAEARHAQILKILENQQT
jgi:hypothetical protein